MISESATGWHLAPENFPRRNRIVARVQIGTVIADGRQCRVSLITARLAMELGREFFGVSRNLTQDVGLAPNPLIDQRAKRVSGEDVT